MPRGEHNPTAVAEQAESPEQPRTIGADSVRKVVESAVKTLVLFSGGSKISDDDLISRAKTCIDVGANGLIFGRNLWQREWDDAVKISKRFRELLQKL
jgi:class I fructose-bisphosphate aldolase